MKFLLKIGAIVLLGIIFSCKGKQLQNTRSDNNIFNSTKEWQSLFNGKNLDGWLPKINGYALNNNYKDTFRVEDGVLKVSYNKYDNFTDQFGHLFYKTQFTYYKLRLQYRFTGKQVRGGQPWAEKNSGIMIHCQSPESMLIKQGFPLSLEFQLLGGVVKDEARPSGNLCTPATHVEMDNTIITEHCIAANSKTYYGEEWISAEVVVTKDSITHYIDGKAVISYMNPTIGGEFLETTAEEIQAMNGQALKGGYIALQSESHPIEFRNIEVLEL